MDPLLDALKLELEFLEGGGYRRPERDLWRLPLIFEDSPVCCARVDDPLSHPCHACPLLQFVPVDCLDESAPCRLIPLTEAGETVESFYAWGTLAELEEALGAWLRRTIRELESARTAGGPGEKTTSAA